MRRIVVVALVVLGGVVIGDAQEFKKDRSSPPFSTVRADRIQNIDGGAHFSGNVSISVAGGTVTADSAIVRHDSQTIELEGHVQLKVNVPTK